MTVKKILSGVLTVALLAAAAGGGYYAVRELTKSEQTTVVYTDDGKVVAGGRHSLFGGETEEIVVREKEEEVPDNRYLSEEEAGEVRLPYAVEYYSSLLPEEQEIVCRQLYNGIKNFDETIYITKDVVDSDEITELIVMCMTSAPAMDYIDSNYSVTVDASGYVSAVEVTYSMTREDSEARSFLLNKSMGDIISHAASGMSDFDKFRYIHDCLIKGCTYDEEAEDAYTAYGCLVSGRAVCEGYSKALMMLCNAMGLPCLPVVGQGIDDMGNSQGHMWNEVMIDGKWYATDITWDDPIFDGSDSYVRYDFFALTDEMMGKNHVKDDNKFFAPPACVSEDADYFVYTDCYVRDMDGAYDALRNAVLTAMSSGDDYARIKCADDETFTKCLSWVFGEGTGAEDIFRLLKEGAGENPDMGYSITGYSVINNKTCRTISVRLKRE
ncbi:MAG: transglutaminase [Ruminococcus sp.]|nr:transglutaminase [Ruminococcus sp.]